MDIMPQNMPQLQIPCYCQQHYYWLLEVTYGNARHFKF